MIPSVINNFMPQEDCNKIIQFIEKNLNIFYTGKYELTHRLLFGIDNYHQNSNQDLFAIEPIKDLVLDYFNKTINFCKEFYKEKDDIYIASFWLARQIEGSFLDYHGDTDNNKNMQFDYTCGIYLNNVNVDGGLSFPKLKYVYKPSEGDLVTWKSRDPMFDHEINKITDTRYTMLLWLTKDPAFNLLGDQNV
jgi:hypothetical protein